MRRPHSEPHPCPRPAPADVGPCPCSSSTRCAPGPADQDREQGSAALWLLLIVPVLFGFAALVLDGGRVLTARQNAANVAEQAARSAVDELNRDAFRGASTVAAIDLSGAQAAACRYATTAGPTSSCSATLVGGQVQVDVTITTRTAMLSALGISQITVAGTGQARPAIGDAQEVPQ